MADIIYRQYVGESDLPHIMALVQNELSEPYVIYTFRYFLHQWPNLSFLAYSSDSASSEPIGVIVCKQSMHRGSTNRGYIAMLSVDKQWRKRGIASTLVRNSIEAMKREGVNEVRTLPPRFPELKRSSRPTQIFLETEYDNYAALSLYESLGFIREKRLYRFYLNGKDAFRLVLVVPPAESDDSSEDSSSSYTAPSNLHLQRRHHQPYRAIPVIPYSDDEDDYESSR
ncbi:acyl-CoA N-acyltransferase [Coprinopsis marcescibilis]|uniref:Acyl-CoA N-acyltransferase n=1 Tax=Coprinopsis marcescibilis TaxID=230819 RepID=A0A5C3KHA2_COPMA|nr:acyl-CoA N-acyltransferase [Coprinopsis marcescibilis]